MEQSYRGCPTSGVFYIVGGRREEVALRPGVGGVEWGGTEKGVLCIQITKIQGTFACNVMH